MARSIAKSTRGHKAALTEHVEVIRSLGKQTIANVIEIGRRLAECKKMVGHKNFGCWLDREFGWSERTAQRFMSIHQLAEAKSDKLSDLDLPISALYLLAAPSTPAPACDEILERAEVGEKIKHAEVKQAIAEAKPEWTKSLRDRRRPPRGIVHRRRGQDVRRVRPHPPERRVEIAPAELPLAPDRRSFEALIEERGGNLEMPLLHDNDGPDSAARGALIEKYNAVYGS